MGSWKSGAIFRTKETFQVSLLRQQPIDVCICVSQHQSVSSVQVLNNWVWEQVLVAPVSEH